MSSQYLDRPTEVDDLAYNYIALRLDVARKELKKAYRAACKAKPASRELIASLEDLKFAAKQVDFFSAGVIGATKELLEIKEKPVPTLQNVEVRKNGTVGVCKPVARPKRSK